MKCEENHLITSLIFLDLDSIPFRSLQPIQSTVLDRGLTPSFKIKIISNLTRLLVQDQVRIRCQLVFYHQKNTLLHKREPRLVHRIEQKLSQSRRHQLLTDIDHLNSLRHLMLTHLPLIQEPMILQPNIELCCLVPTDTT